MGTPVPSTGTWLVVNGKVYYVDEFWDVVRQASDGRRKIEAVIIEQKEG